MTEYNFNIALIICTYNRDKFLKEAFNSIIRQSLPKDEFQVIIIDNNSTDNTAQISKEFISENPEFHISYYFESNKGLSFARNRGIKESNASIISYIDDDVILSEDYLKKINIFFKEYELAVGIGGKVIPKYESGAEPVWMNKYLNGFVGKVDFGNSIKMYDSKMKYPTGCNMTYKRDILIKAGGFNNELKFRSDDKFIYSKIKVISNKVYYLPHAWLYHYIDYQRLEFDSFKKLFLKTGNEEKKRIFFESGLTGIVKKLFEFTFKLGASFIILLLFISKSEYIKGKYVFLSQWYTLVGFLKKDVFVR